MTSIIQTNYNNTSKTDIILNNQENANKNINNGISFETNNKSLFENDENNSIRIMEHNNSTDSSMTEVKNEMNFDEKIEDQSVDDLFY